MAGRVSLLVLLAFGLPLGLGGCGATVGLYHSAEGGAIARQRQAPPGADAPYPNLASVPEAPVALGPKARARVNKRLANPAYGTGVSAPSPEALAGLALPAGPPPMPDVPDLVIPQAPVQQVAPVVVAAPAPVVPVKPPSAPVALAFLPGSAVLNPDAAVALHGVAAATGGGSLLVAGFGEGGAVPDQPALALALARAQRLADALTADGVAPGAIRLLAAAGGSGGFVQLFY